MSSKSHDQEGDFCPAQQARAYGELLPVYESRLSILQSVHAVVLDRVLEGMPVGASVLEVGCGAGSSLQLLADRGFRAEGVDISSEMANAAHIRSGCPVHCADFLKFDFPRQYDLVFAQAFVHLFPKALALNVVCRLKSIALKRVFFSTSLAEKSSEGLEKKDGILRYRSRYTSSEFLDLVAASVSDKEWHAEYFDLPDTFGKKWRDVILHRNVSS